MHTEVVKIVMKRKTRQIEGQLTLIITIYFTAAIHFFLMYELYFVTNIIMYNIQVKKISRISLTKDETKIGK